MVKNAGVSSILKKIYETIFDYEVKSRISRRFSLEFNYYYYERKVIENVS